MNIAYIKHQQNNNDNDNNNNKQLSLVEKTACSLLPWRVFPRSRPVSMCWLCWYVGR